MPDPLPHPADLRQIVLAKPRGEACDEDALDQCLKFAIAEIGKRQIACSLEVVKRRRIVQAELYRLRICADRRSEDRQRIAPQPQPMYRPPSMMAAIVDPITKSGHFLFSLAADFLGVTSTAFSNMPDLWFRQRDRFCSAIGG
jgi:hypothetical protein